jgi:flagellar hook-associated protein 2
MFSIDGLVSGFDTSTIVESLLQFQQAQVDKFNARKAEITTKQTAFKGIEAQLLTLRTSMGRLNRTQSSVFGLSSAKSSNEEIATVVADHGATPGVYQISVESLATAQQLASQGFANETEQVASGTITIQVGNRAEQTIEIGPGNNTLDGFIASINDQVKDISASLVKDQSTNTYRILLASRHTGAANTINITSDLDSSSGSIPDFSGPAVQEANNAVVKLGSGPGALSAEYASNQIEDLISNVTMDLKKASPGQLVTVSVQRDTSAAKEAIQTFVEDFNSIIEFIDGQTRFNAETNQASPLLGNRSVTSIKNRLLTAVSNTVSSGGNLTRLSQIGIDLDTKGRLLINSNRLDQALKGELDNVDPNAIRGLFGLNARSTNAGIKFLTGGPRTQSSTTPYQVDISQAAERATVTGSNPLAGSTVIDETNNKLQITLDGIVSEELTLASGTFTASDLAAHVQSTINASTTLGVHNVLVAVSPNNELLITSEAFGTSASVASISGSAAASMGFNGTESDTGQDVAGKFIVEGVEEIAKGSGRVLIGDSNNSKTADLQLLVTLTSGQLSEGAEADVQVSRGVTGELEKYIGELLHAEKGMLKNVNDGFQTRLASIDRSIERVEDITSRRREALIAEFAALESILSDLQNTGSFITSQLASLRSFSNSRNR